MAVEGLLPAVREGEGLLAAAVALKDAAQQVIDSHQNDDPVEPVVDPPPVEPVADPPPDPGPVVSPVADVLAGLVEVLSTEGATTDE